ncbi:MAG: nucleotidyltransferase domain-containing protein [Actinobacteria bacterium]|nr:nucleotidyltransferase domain-containing protein [Actinomycetota bacterium]MCG2820040.1 nucleotidyltransferase domain-containing protein [Actinomycetes bacterium]MBU4219596.1 nucleotidyltransferase domain-containing protein [Actinomycetota bacterium]MBU4357894.1 nucleotidyltransferase domain-containing protein [Actinomycetota bacterium]MBU4401157.1 nucleotidyltransferase domain-containing protein [Actinomycetota bacterium]
MKQRDQDYEVNMDAASTLQRMSAKRKSREKKLTSALKVLTEQLSLMGAKKIILFGSLADSRVGSWSDLDLLVVMPDSKSGKEWFREIYEKTDLEVPADIFPFTEEELEHKTPQSSFIRHALKTGKVVYEKG